MKRGRTKSPLDRYRHDSLHVWLMAEQEYCEKRLDLWLDNPTTSRVSLPPGVEEDFKPETIEHIELQNDSANLGVDFHQRAEKAETDRTLPEAKPLLNKGASLTIAECSMQGEYKGLPIMGKADAVHFVGGQASSVIEYKVTKSRCLHPTHEVQLRLYGYLLEKEMFDVKNLILICVFVPSNKRDWIESLPPAGAKRLSQRVIKLSERFKEIWPERKSWYPRLRLNRSVELTLGVFKYNPNKTRKELDFLIDYWLGRRRAIPTRNPNKCATCLYSSLKRCSDARAPFQGHR